MGDSFDLQFTPRRLSKPRTNKSSSNLLAEQPTPPSSPHNSSDLDYFGSDAVVVDSRGERRSRSKSRGRIKAYLYGSSHDLVQTSSDEEETQTGIAGAARDVRKRLSRTGSSMVSLRSTKASVTRHSNSSSSGLLSSRSTEWQGMDPEESALIADQIKERAYHDSLAAQNHVPAPRDEDKHVDSTMAPLRRKSLYTPGIATRNASDILRKPPKPMTDHEYYYNPQRPETSPLSHLASLSVVEDGRSTPCNLHYPQLGGLQLGTLRVTNGASSPVPGSQPPDLAYRSATPESKTLDEYYTASEGSVTGDRDHAITLPLRAGSPMGLESKTEGSMGVDNGVPSTPRKSLAFERISSDESFPFSREGSDQAARFTGLGLKGEISGNIPEMKKGGLDAPLPFNERTSKTCPPETLGLIPQNEPLNEIQDLGKENFRNSFCLEMGLPKSYRVSEETLGEHLSLKGKASHEILRFEGPTLSESLPSKTRSSNFGFVRGRKPDECCRFGAQSPNGALDIADEYIAEFEGIPFSCRAPECNKATIPHSQDSINEERRPRTVEANLTQAGNGSGSREAAFRKLTLNGDMPSTRKPEGLSVPPAQPSRRSASSETPQTDSGYGSYASLTEQPANGVGFKSESNPVRPTNSTASSQPQTLETVRDSARSPFRDPLRKLRKQRPKSQPPPVNLIPIHHELTNANIPRIPSIIAVRHANRLSRFPLLEHTFPSSQHTTANAVLSPVQVHDAPIRFPSPANALEAASAPLEPLRIATSRLQPSTVIVDEDNWSASHIVRSPSWSEFGGGRRKKEQRRLAKEERDIEKRQVKEEKELGKRLQKDRKELNRHTKKDENKLRFTRSRSAPRIRARSSEGQSRHDVPITIADFGTVTESLGNSPYDVAKSTPPNPQNTRNWHPHQISTAMPRPNPSLSARARAQTLFLDMPSVPALAAVDLKAHNVEWARERRRSQTSSAVRTQSSNDSSSVPANFARADSVTMGATPPVPALPSANQVRRREAEIIRSRPHSMFLEAPVPIAILRKIEDKNTVPHPSESGSSAAPRKTKDSEIVPELWSCGSLERKCAKTVDGSRQASNNLVGENDKAISTKDQLWETQSNAWSQRRKSAGEALLKNRVKDGFDNQEAASPTVLCGHNAESTPSTGIFTPGVYQTFMPIPSHLGPFPNPLASHPQWTTQQPNSVPDPYDQSTIQQTQRCGLNYLPSTPRPCVSSVSSFQQGNQTPTSTPSRAQPKSFRIQRKRVGSGPSMIRAETTIGSSCYESVLG